MKKRIYAILIALCMVLSSAAFSIDTYAQDFIFLPSNNGEYVITKCFLWDTEIVIPDTYEGIPVTTIESGAFAKLEKLEKVIIPDSVTTIKDNAFWGCPNLKSVIIADSVKEIGKYAFAECSNLTEVKLPEGLTELKYKTFFFCKSLSKINFPESLTTIGESAFEHCNGFKNLTIPGTVKTIEQSAFDGCLELTDLTISYGVTTIDGGAFAGCDNLKNVTISDSVTKMGGGTFASCPALESITIPGSLQTINDGMFRQSVGLKNVTLLDGVTKIGYEAFLGCEGLENIIIPDSVTEIDARAFAGCQSLKTFPHTVAKIGQSAFQYCHGFTNLVIPNGVTEIGGGAFRNCENLKTVTIPESVTTIEGYAFADSLSLTSFFVDENNPSYASVDGVLYDKNKTALVYYPRGKEDTVYYVPEGVTTIKSGAFGGDQYNNKPSYNINILIFPNSLKTIEDSALTKCNPVNVHYKGDENSWNAVEKGKNKTFFLTKKIYCNLGEQKVIRVFLDSNETFFKIPPMIESGRTLVQLRIIFEAIGARVKWDGETQTVTATKDGKTIVLKIGSDKMTVDGKVVNLDVAPKIVNNLTMVPLRAISESFNLNVEWDGENRIININQ